MSDLTLVVTTIDDREKASEWAAELIQKRLAACVQIVGPVESVYEWESKLVHDTEWQLQIKTSSNLQAKVVNWIQDRHPYEIPEIITIPISFGSAQYSEWVDRQLRL